MDLKKEKIVLISRKWKKRTGHAKERLERKLKGVF